MKRDLRRLCSWLVFGLALYSSPLGAQMQMRPTRSIPLPPACQHPFRDLYSYGAGQRIGLKPKSGFCRVDLTNGGVKQFGGLGEIEGIGPAPKSFQVAIIGGFHHLTVLDDDGRSQFDGDLDLSGVPAIYWSSDESHIIVFSFPDESDEADMVTIVNILRKTIKTILLKPSAAVTFDSKTNTIRAVQKLVKVTVYDLEGKALRHEIARRTGREHSDSASKRYFYWPKHEIGEGDTLIHQVSSGRVVAKLQEYKTISSRNFALWDNPLWNPVEDDLLLLLYISVEFGKGKDLTELDVFSVLKHKPTEVFPFGEKGTPAYGWSRDGKQVILCDVDCSLYSAF